LRPDSAAAGLKKAHGIVRFALHLLEVLVGHNVAVDWPRL
jgi:hypothetical protein